MGHNQSEPRQDRAIVLCDVSTAIRTLDAIKEIVGDRNVIGSSELLSRSMDFWTPSPTEAVGLVKPESTQQLSRLLALCNDAGQPVIVEGGRTNLVAGTHSNSGSLLISLEHLNTIGVPDPQGLTVEVGAGAILETVQERCAAAGVRFGLDFGARGSATIGGVLATNAGGFQALRYGVARDQVLGLECVLADGTILSHLVPFAKDNTGYDLKQVFIGSEGTLGVITRVMLKLHPSPSSRQTGLLAFESFEAVAQAMTSLRRGLRDTISAYEVMWREFFDFNVEAILNGRSPFVETHPYYVLCEAEGFDPETDGELFQSAIADLLEAGLVSDAVIATSSRQRLELWKIREDFEAEMAWFQTMVDFDVSLPISTMDRFVEEVKRRLDLDVPKNLGLHVFGHLGDGNLHVTTGIPEPEGKEDVQRLIYELISHFGGSVSAEHGIGLAKRNYLHYSRTEAEVATMRLIKGALDPQGILNPGKIFPVD